MTQQQHKVKHYLRQSNIKYQMSNINYQISNIKDKISNIKYQISKIKYQISTVNYQLSNIKYAMTIKDGISKLKKMHCSLASELTGSLKEI
jgi:predicted  nucleic acid-binding Zn-ribbon protein